MEQVSNNTLLFWSSQLLNVVTLLSSSVPVFLKWIIAALGVILTIISLINQAVLLYRNAKRWHVLIVIEHYWIKIKKKKQNNS